MSWAFDGDQCPNCGSANIAMWAVGERERPSHQPEYFCLNCDHRWNRTAVAQDDDAADEEFGGVTVNTSQNVISIDTAVGDNAIMFRAAADDTAAFALWVFLVENIRPGFFIELVLGTKGDLPARMVRGRSGEKLPDDRDALFAFFTDRQRPFPP
jgi:hypothetical protein